MRNPLSTWQKNKSNINQMHCLHAHLSNLLPAIDLSDILRSEFVLIVSAFDCYIHDTVLIEMSNMFNGIKAMTNNMEEFCIPVSCVKNIINTSDSETQNNLFNAAVKKILSKDSYQSPKSIEYALSLINIGKIWTEVGKNTGTKPADVKTTLGLIVQRRNKIAHESDTKDMTTVEKNSIDREDIEDVINFLDTIVIAIENKRTIS